MMFNLIFTITILQLIGRNQSKIDCKICVEKNMKFFFGMLNLIFVHLRKRRHTTFFYDNTYNFTPYFSESTCTFPSELEGDWYSAYKGKLTFNSTHVTGYPIYMSAAVLSLDFECYINEGRKYLLRYIHAAVWKHSFKNQGHFIMHLSFS